MYKQGILLDRFFFAPGDATEAEGILYLTKYFNKVNTQLGFNETNGGVATLF